MGKEKFKKELVAELYNTFECTRNEAETVALRAEQVNSETDESLDMDWIIDHMSDAPDNNPLYGKWNWAISTPTPRFPNHDRYEIS